MKKWIWLLFSLFSLPVFAQKRDSLPQLGKNDIEKVISALSKEEKVSLLMGLGLGNFKNPTTGEKTVIIPGTSRTFSVSRLGITPVVLADGPSGLHIQPTRENDPQFYYCTAFPTATALASSWNTELVGNVGKTMGNEVLEYGCDVLLAPAMNIQRNPLCGRNFEYFSEDPLLSGKFAAALVRGIQENGVGACLKHFAANNQETNRLNFDPQEVGTGWHRITGNPVINAVISQRALREIYLRGFEIAVKESHPMALMSSYNRLNGFFTSENKDLLTTILRNEWGFDGVVTSDWRAGSDAPAQMMSGNDLLMPGCYQREDLLLALKNKTLDQHVVDRNLERILSLVMKTPRYKGYPFSSKPNLEQHANVARQSAVESMVLLKNSNSTLPLKGVQRVALFGKTSYRFITGGTGSGEVNYAHAVSPREGLIKAGYMLVKPLEEVYEHFIDTLLSNSKQENKKFLVDFHSELDLSIAFIAKQEALSDVAIITIGRNSGEGWDRKEKDDFVLSEIEYSLIRNISKIYHAARKRVVVVLNIGGVMEVASWRDYSDAILLAWQTGQEGGTALTDILIGNENPSGKLAVTFPMVYSDVPSAKIFPGEPKENPVNAFYNDGIYVGYRYYSSFHINTAYEFGFGMSYTDFQYSNLTLSETTFKDSMKVSVTIKNIGIVPGKEAVQLYISAPKNEIEKPALELKAFAKTELLKVSESQIVTFMIHSDLLASFWSGASAWIADKGQYEVQIGASSKDIRLKTAFTLPNTIMVEEVNNVLYPNYLLKEINQ